MYYAVFNPETRIVFAIDQVDHQMSGNDRVRINCEDQDFIGRRFVGTVTNDEFTLSDFEEIPEWTLGITLDKYSAFVGDSISATAIVKDQNGETVTSVDGINYYVPVLRQADSYQAKLLKVVFVQGQASVSFSISDPGIYVIDLSKIHPVPQSKLSESPVLIIEDKD